MRQHGGNHRQVQALNPGTWGHVKVLSSVRVQYLSHRSERKHTIQEETDRLPWVTQSGRIVHRM